MFRLLQVQENQGWVVVKLVDVNPGLNINWGITFFFVSKCFSPLMIGVVLDYFSSKLKGKQCKLIT